MCYSAPPAVPSVQATPPMALQDIITSERIVESGLLNDPAGTVLEHAALLHSVFHFTYFLANTCIVRSMLLPLLPEGQQTDGALEENVRSPQFRQAIASLSDVLNSDNFNSVMANFNIDPSPGMSHMVSVLAASVCGILYTQLCGHEPCTVVFILICSY